MRVWWCWKVGAALLEYELTGTVLLAAKDLRELRLLL